MPSQSMKAIRKHSDPQQFVTYHLVGENTERENVALRVILTDSDGYALEADEGKLIIAGYDYAQAAIDVIEQAPYDASTWEEIDEPWADAITASGSTSARDLSEYTRIKIQIIATGVTSGATVELQDAFDGTNYETISSLTISADGVYSFTIENTPLKNAILDFTITDGTYTALVFCAR